MKTMNKLVVICVAAVLLSSLALLPGGALPVRADSGWQKHSANPVFVEGISSGGASVIYDSAEGTYKMWFTRTTTDLDRLDSLIDEIAALNLGNLVSHLRNLNWRGMAEEAPSLEQLLDFLAGLDLETLRALLVGTDSTIGYATSLDGISWSFQGYTDLKGGSGDWDEHFVGSPSVIKVGGQYKMWYTGGRVNPGAIAPILDHLATLRTQDIETLLEYVADLNLRGLIDYVVDEIGIPYMLELVSLVSTAIQDGAEVGIGYATSTDGINWQKLVSAPVLQGTPGSWDKWGVATPSVVRTGDNTYEMWYTGVETDTTPIFELAVELLLNGDNLDDIEGLVDEIESVLLASVNMAIGRAVSTDGGETWTPDANPVFQKGTGDVWDTYAVATPSVLKTSTGYEMWYSGGKVMPNLLLDFLRGINSLETTIITGTDVAIGRATSNDGITWTRDGSNPILSKGSVQQWDKYGAGSPSVVKRGDTYHMWYTGGKSHLGDFLLSVLDGKTLAAALIETEAQTAIGYASYTVPVVPPPPPVEVWFPPPVPEVPGIIDISGYIDPVTGVVTRTIVAYSYDRAAWLTIPAGIVALDADGKPLTKITMVEHAAPEPPPEGTAFVAEVYDFGPDGATFQPPVTLTMSYVPALIPEGVDEENLVIVWHDGQDWTPLDPDETVIDKEKLTVSAPVGGFTAFTVLAYTRPAAFAASDLRVTPEQVDIGEEVTIRAFITNSGDLKGSHLVELKIDGVTVASREVTLAGRASQEVTFTITAKAAGTFRVAVDGLTATFLVREVVPPPPVKPAAFIVSQLIISPEKVSVRETVRITVTVTNVGEASGSHEVVFLIDDKKVFSREVTLAGGESTEVSFTTVGEAAGTYTVMVDGLKGIFTVEEVPPVVPPIKPPVNWPLIIGIIAGVVIIGVAVWLIIRWRRSRLD